MSRETKRPRGFLTLSTLGTAQGRRDAWRTVVEPQEITRSKRAWAAWAAADDCEGERIPFRVEKTFVTVGPEHEARDSSCPPALARTARAARAATPASPQAAERSPDEGQSESASTAATEKDACLCDAFGSHKEFLTCAFAKAFTCTCSWAAWASKEPGSAVSRVAALPAHIPFKVENTFVTVKPLGGARARSGSCPARVSLPCTVMLRNLPNRAKARRIEEHLHRLGFTDFKMYLPLDPRTGVNKGYVFVRLPDEAVAAAFCAAVHHTRLPDVPGSRSAKRLTAAFAADQGALRTDRGGVDRCLWPRTVTSVDR